MTDPSGPTIDSLTGGVRLTRAELARLVEERASGTNDGIRPAAPGDIRARAMLEPVLATITATRSRGTVRTWRDRHCQPVAEVIVGDTGVVVLTGGGRPDDIQEPRWHPRPTVVARVLAELVDLPTRPAPPPLAEGPHRWDDLVARATGPSAALHLADLRWSHDATTEPASVLVLAWHPAGGIAELVPHDDGNGSLHALPRHPLEIWTGLTTLAVTPPRQDGVHGNGNNHGGTAVDG